MEKFRFEAAADGNDAPSPVKTGSKTTTSNDRLRRIPVTALVQKANAVVIEHQGEDYILRITRNKKLILTK